MHLKMKFYRLQRHFLISGTFLVILFIFQNCSNAFKGAVPSDLSSQSFQLVEPEIKVTSVVPEVMSSPELSIDYNIESSVELKSVNCSIFIANQSSKSVNCGRTGVTLSDLQEGDQSLSIEAETIYGAKSILKLNIRRDASPPQIMIAPAQPAVSGSNKASFTLTVTDSLSGVASIECQVDQATPVSCDTTYSVANLNSGSHTLKVIAKDRAQNLKETSYSWTIDLSQPIVKWDAVPSLLTNLSSATFEFSSDKAAQFECSLNGAPFESCSTSLTLKGNRTLTGLTPNQEHIFRVRSIDSLGNTSSPLEHKWKIDTTAPSLPVITSNLISPSKNSQAQLMFSSNDANGIKLFECSLDNQTFSLCQSPKTVSFSEGQKSYYVRALDNASNKSAVATYTVFIDTTIPVIQFTQSPTNGSQTSALISFSILESGSGVDRIQCSLDSAAFSNCSSPLTLNNITAGAHVFKVQASDKAGNISVVTSVSWSVSTLPPIDPVPPNSCKPISPVTLTGVNPLNFVQAAKVPSGPYAGAYTVAKGDARIVWYFSNLALLGFVDQIPEDVKSYMTLYLKSASDNWSIKDIHFPVSGGALNYAAPAFEANGVGAYSDSDDSYAATLLSLALRYYNVTCDKTWFQSIVPNKNITVLEALKKVATNNLVNSLWPNGLIHVFQSESMYYIAYTEDNMEAYRGLIDFVDLLKALGDNQTSSYQTTAEKVRQAMITYMYSSNLLSGTQATNMPGFYYYWGDASNFNGPAEPLANPMKFYPDGATQIFAQAYRLNLPAQMYKDGWNFLNAKFPNYTTNEYDNDPWVLIGYAAALDGNSALATKMQEKAITSQNGGIGVPINNWGFHRRISFYLQKGQIF